MTLRSLANYDKARLVEAVEYVTELAGNTRVALCGGLAMEHYGSPRLTEDVDVLVEQAIADGRPLEFDGRCCGVTVQSPEDVAIDMIELDQVDDYRKLYVEALERSVTVDDLPLKIVRPEHLLMLKMIAMRSKDEEDIEFLLLNVDLNRSMIRDVLNRTVGTYARKSFDLMWEEAEWKKERKRSGR